jgi:hypothetical protein
MTENIQSWPLLVLQTSFPKNLHDSVCSRFLLARTRILPFVNHDLFDRLEVYCIHAQYVFVTVREANIQ